MQFNKTILLLATLAAVLATTEAMPSYLTKRHYSTRYGNSPAPSGNAPSSNNGYGTTPAPTTPDAGAAPSTNSGYGTPAPVPSTGTEMLVAIPPLLQPHQLALIMLAVTAIVLQRQLQFHQLVLIMLVAYSTTPAPSTGTDNAGGNSYGTPAPAPVPSTGTDNAGGNTSTTPAPSTGTDNVGGNTSTTPAPSTGTDNVGGGSYAPAPVPSTGTDNAGGNTSTTPAPSTGTDNAGGNSYGTPAPAPVPSTGTDNAGGNTSTTPAHQLVLTMLAVTAMVLLRQLQFHQLVLIMLVVISTLLRLQPQLPLQRLHQALLPAQAIPQKIHTESISLQLSTCTKKVIQTKTRMIIKMSAKIMSTAIIMVKSMVIMADTKAIMAITKLSSTNNGNASWLSDLLFTCIIL
ncbi:hypothetical protein BDF19DRAFT_402911 [Syncephalis fuscata]|nr:hypothetical protein BDF19DRAFT_402911 [Syncephalis fuscata]